MNTIRQIKEELKINKKIIFRCALIRFRWGKHARQMKFMVQWIGNTLKAEKKINNAPEDESINGFFRWSEFLFDFRLKLKSRSMKRFYKPTFKAKYFFVPFRLIGRNVIVDWPYVLIHKIVYKRHYQISFEYSSLVAKDDPKGTIRFSVVCKVFN